MFYFRLFNKSGALMRRVRNVGASPLLEVVELSDYRSVVERLVEVLSDDPRVDPTGTPMSVTGEYNPKIYPLEQIRYPLIMTNLMTALRL